MPDRNSVGHKFERYIIIMYSKTRNDEVALLKDLWQERPTVCPKCGKGMLEHLHRKAKKSNCDWKCPKCGEIFRTIGMLKNLPDN